MDFATRVHEAILALDHLTVSPCGGAEAATGRGGGERGGTGRGHLGSRSASLYLGDEAAEAVVKRMMEKLCSKVHRAKDNAEGRRLIMLTVSSDKIYIKQLLSVCEITCDPLTATLTLGVLRECVAARSLWRSECLATMVEVNAVDTVLKTLLRFNGEAGVSSANGGIADHGLVCAFWVLSAIATKDPKFSYRFRLSGALRLVNPFLKRLASKSVGLYPVLQTTKALARNAAISASLGKDGVLSTLVHVLKGLREKKYCPRTKVALEALFTFLKAKPNLTHLLDRHPSCVSVLLDLLSQYEAHAASERLCSKVVGTTLNIFLRFVSTDGGQRLLKEEGGLEALKELCVNSKSRYKRWNRILARACAVISYCCEGAPLPLGGWGIDCPMKFDIPESFGYPHHDVLTSASTSRETTPDEYEDYDEDEEDEDEKDEEEDFAEDEEGEEEAAGEEESVQSCIRGGSSSKSANNVKRSLSDLRDSYEHLFAEFREGSDGVGGVGAATEEGKGLLGRGQASSVAPVRRPSSSLCYRDRYAEKARSTDGLAPFVKVAYPDLVGACGPTGDEDDPAHVRECLPEPLNENDLHVYREKISQNVRNILREADAYDTKTVFDLDALLQESSSSGGGGGDNGPSAEWNHRGCNDDVARISRRRRGVYNGPGLAPLRFESRFECGNLRRAVRSGEAEYELLLTPDVNTARHHQWFYFEVSGMVADVEYTFNIINHEKANSQYNFGMQPLLLSVRECEQGGGRRCFWRRAGHDILYFKNHYSRATAGAEDGACPAKQLRHQTTSFSVVFPHSDDVCYLAYHYPYTYTKLMVLLDDLSVRSSPDLHFRSELLCRTVRGHPVPIVTVTSAFGSVDTRPVVFLTARVHPGETNASWAMQGTLEFLCSSSDPRAAELRSRFVFKVVPMLNVEGVVNGCHRCGLTGEDLNRRWISPHSRAHPSVYHAKGAVEYCVRALASPPAVFCDYHGHSRKKGVFLYGCSPAQSWAPMDVKFCDELDRTHLQLERALDNIEPCFDRLNCRYVVEKARESTAREFRVARSYTMETTFCGFNRRGPVKGSHISTWHLLSVGRSLALAVLSLSAGGLGGGPPREDVVVSLGGFNRQQTQRKDKEQKQAARDPLIDFGRRSIKTKRLVVEVP